MRRLVVLLASVTALGLVATGCSSDSHHDMGDMMDGPSGVAMPAGSAAFLSVSPAGGATGVSTSTTITLRFGAAMAVGMEDFMDLHVGDLSGGTIPMSCAWSGDRTVLNCTPTVPLQSHTTYWIHLGGGWMTQAGQPVDYSQYGPMMGGQWIQGTMMGSGFHAGAPWGMMTGYWRNTNGAYGLAFSFTTA